MFDPILFPVLPRLIDRWRGPLLLMGDSLKETYEICYGPDHARELPPYIEVVLIDATAEDQASIGYVIEGVAIQEDDVPLSDLRFDLQRDEAADHIARAVGGSPLLQRAAPEDGTNDLWLVVGNTRHLWPISRHTEGGPERATRLALKAVAELLLL